MYGLLRGVIAPMEKQDEPEHFTAMELQTLVPEHV